MEPYYELLCGSRVWVAARIVMTHGVKDLHPWTWAQHFQRDIYCNNTNFTEAWAANRRTAALLPLNSKCSQRVEWIWLGMRAAPPKVGWAASPLARAKKKCSPAQFGEGAQLDQGVPVKCQLSVAGLSCCCPHRDQEREALCQDWHGEQTQTSKISKGVPDGAEPQMGSCRHRRTTDYDLIFSLLWNSIGLWASNQTVMGGGGIFYFINQNQHNLFLQ